MGCYLSYSSRRCQKWWLCDPEKKASRNRAASASSANRQEHDRVFGREYHGSGIANRRTTSVRHGPQEMMLRSRILSCQATAVRLAFFNQTLLSWKAAPPIGATASAPVRTLMPWPPI